MSELSPRARQVLRSSVKRATVADRERIQNALHAKLGMTALTATEASRVTPSPARWPLVSGAIVGVGLIGGALFLAARHEPPAATPAPPPVASVLATAAPASPPTAQAVAPAPVSSLPAAPASELAPAVPRPSPDRLAQEVAFLERATSALHAGRPSAALKVLNDYQRKFPNGLLALERSAARAQALCSLGRQSEAHAELSRLPMQSPAVARAKQVCDATSKSGH